MDMKTVLYRVIILYIGRLCK